MVIVSHLNHRIDKKWTSEANQKKINKWKLID